MNYQVTIKVGNCLSRIEADRKIIGHLDSETAVEVPGAFYARRYRPSWDGFWHPVDVVRNTFPTGLLMRVKRILPMAIVVDQRVRPHTIPYTPGILKDITLADHQVDAVNIALEKGQGVLALAMSAGKSEVGLAVACHVEGLCVWLVHRKDLLHQMAERIKLRTGHDAVKIGDGQWENITPDTKFAVVMPQTIDKDAGFFADSVKSCSVVVYDEAHRLAAATNFYKIGMLVPAFYRLALTGSPETGDPVRDRRLESSTGEIIMRIRASALAEMGWSARANVIYHKIENEPIPFAADYMTVRRLLIEENPYRNAKVVELALDAAENGKRCLIICDTIRHARLIAEIMRGESVRTKLLTGKHSSMIRRDARKDLKTGVLETLIATSIFDEGIDLPELETVILAAGGKSAVRVLQRVGRALRKAPGKTEATIHDFLDTGSKYTLKHSFARMATCKREGFHIVTANVRGDNMELHAQKQMHELLVDKDLEPPE